MDIAHKIGRRIRELRKHQSLSQEKLALECGLDRTYINSLENGKRNVSVQTLEKIIKALAISWHAFFDAQEFYSISPHSPTKHKILILDDDLQFRRAMEEMLQDEYDVTAVENPIRATELLNTHAYDLVVADYRLKGMTGLDFIKSQQSRLKSSAVIMITGSGTFEMATEALSNGVRTILPKPFQVEDFLRAVRQSIHIQKWVNHSARLTPPGAK